MERCNSQTILWRELVPCPYTIFWIVLYREVMPSHFLLPSMEMGSKIPWCLETLGGPLNITFISTLNSLISASNFTLNNAAYP